MRLYSQCLAERRPRKAVAEVVKVLVGVNAQLPSAMALSLRARVEGLTLEDIEASRVRDRSIVRTWCMRGTMHLLAADDLDWLLSALAPSVRESGLRWLARRGGLEHTRAVQVLDAAHAILKRQGPLTRPELMEQMAVKFGNDIKSAAAGVVHLNGVLGRVCFGPMQRTDRTYVALDGWLGRKVSLSDQPDYIELARRYLSGYGPATPRDLAAWWGIGVTRAQSAWAQLQKELVELRVQGEATWLLASQSALLSEVHPIRRVILLPAFDTYLLGYRDRDFAVPPKYQRRVFHGGEIVPVVLVDGCAAGTWRYETRGKQIRITVTPFSSFRPEIRGLISEEADDIGRFFGLTPTLTYNRST
ncbi:MAG: winged helix DNA-binding domain-containing protein [Acidobacteriota bacterium]